MDGIRPLLNIDTNANTDNYINIRTVQGTVIN